MIKDKNKTPVAKDVVTMCTRCKMELSHVVLSHNREGIINKVKCHTCGSEHKYRIEKPKKSRKTPKKADKSKRTKKRTKNNYDALIEKFHKKDPVPYSMSGSFQEDDVVDHKSFGIGVVTDVSTQNMEVIFPEGPRFLVCNR